MPGQNGASSRVKAARPTFKVGGREEAGLAAGLLTLEIAESVEGLYRCEAVFGNWGLANGSIGFLYFDRQTLDFGKSFAVLLDADPLFSGRVMALEGGFPEGRPPELGVLAEDRGQDLRMTRRTRTFLQATDADVFNKVAQDHGLRADINAPGPTYPVLAQTNQSDLAFLRERARAIEAEVWVEDTTLHVQPRAQRAGTSLTMTYGKELREFSVLADLALQRTTVTVSGWDVGGKAALTHEATDSVVQSELNGGDSGASVLASALGQRKEMLAHTVPLSSAEARAEAEAFFKMTARRFLVGRGVVETSAQLRVGRTVELAGLGPLFSGKYYVSEVRHLFDGQGGLRTEFMAERPGLGRG